MRARRLAPTLAGIVLGLAILPSLAACASGGNAGAASASEVNLSGTPVAAKDEVTALCKQIVAQALTLEAAQSLAEASGYQSRTTKVDGKGQAVTMDVRDDRFNFEVTAGVVTACTVG